MKKVITYGTFDLFHDGHRYLLERAKKLGDYLIVGVTTDNYDISRGKLNVSQNLLERVENVKASGIADEIIIEEFEGQKIIDIQDRDIDIFAIGSDWVGKFDYLEEYCKVEYLDRTKGVSSTLIRSEKNGIISIGIIGSGRIANRFLKESKYVSGVNVEGVFGIDEHEISEFAKQNELSFYETNLESFFSKVDLVYIATPHIYHYDYSKKSLMANKHVLCEKPLAFKPTQIEELFYLAEERNLVLVEAIKTAFFQGFQRMVSLVKSGIIGQVVNVEASFTKLLLDRQLREFDLQQKGGALTELITYSAFAVSKILGHDFESIDIKSFYENRRSVDIFSTVNFKYKKSTAIIHAGIGAKKEGDLVITGTKGYVYCPAPWWLTKRFDVRYEDQNRNVSYFFDFEKDGLRYEIAEMANFIQNGKIKNNKVSKEDSMFISIIFDKYYTNHTRIYLEEE